MESENRNEIFLPWATEIAQKWKIYCFQMLTLEIVYYFTLADKMDIPPPIYVDLPS